MDAIRGVYQPDAEAGVLAPGGVRVHRNERGDGGACGSRVGVVRLSGCGTKCARRQGAGIQAKQRGAVWSMPARCTEAVAPCWRPFGGRALNWWHTRATRLACNTARLRFPRAGRRAAHPPWRILALRGDRSIPSGAEASCVVGEPQGRLTGGGRATSQSDRVVVTGGRGDGGYTCTSE